MKAGDLVRLSDETSTTIVWSSISIKDDPQIVGSLKKSDVALVVHTLKVGGYIRAVGPDWVGWIHSTHIVSVS